MRIGIDCRTILDSKLETKAGVGHYTYHLVDSLLKCDNKNEYFLFFDRSFKDTKYFKRDNSTVKYFPFIQYKKFLPFAYSHLLVAAFLGRQWLDVYHSPAYTIPLTYTKSAVVTVHDLAIYHQAKWFPKGQKFATKISVPTSVKKAKKIIAVSESTKRDINKFLKIPAHKIKVIYEGIDKRVKKNLKVKEKFGIKNKFIFFLGTLEPRKNIVGLIKAFNKLRGTSIYKNYQLVIAGAKGWLFKDIFETVKDLKLSKKVIFTDYVSQEDKIGLLDAASLFVFPSFYEGFGLPVLEAMRQGTPVICSNITSLPEVAGQAAILVNPYKIKDISQAIQKVLTDRKLYNQLLGAGFEQAKRFAWEKCARETLKIYEEVARMSPKPKKGREKKRKA